VPVLGFRRSFPDCGPRRAVVEGGAERGKTSIFPIRFKPIIIVDDGMAPKSTTNITTTLSTGWSVRDLLSKRLYAHRTGW